jgi:hypothetical protein
MLVIHIHRGYWELMLKPEIKGQGRLLVKGRALKDISAPLPAHNFRLFFFNNFRF